MERTHMSAAPAAVAEVADDIRSLADLTGDPCPAPGQWEDETYLKLTDHINRLVELTDGFVELLPMPSREPLRMMSWHSWPSAGFRSRRCTAAAVPLLKPEPVTVSS